MNRAPFFTMEWNGAIHRVIGYTGHIPTSNGHIIDVGIYRPMGSRTWYAVERTSGLCICAGAHTRDEVIRKATYKADDVWRIIERADDPSYTDGITVRFRETRKKMSEFVKEDAERSLRPID